MKHPLLACAMMVILVTACNPQAQGQDSHTPFTATPYLQTSPTQPGTPTRTTTPTVTPTPTQTLTPTLRPTLAPNAWMVQPVVPEAISEKTRQIYALGQQLGRNPHAFSKVGDCNSTMPYFLGDFDNPEAYNLGEYTNLQPVIDQFPGSFSRHSLATKNGLSAGAAMATLWADWKDCGPTENPLSCELRVNNPAFVLVSVGANDSFGYETFEQKMRNILDYSISLGVVPILVTKPDNQEGNHVINETIVRLAYEYEVPLWNFWASLMFLPDYGLRDSEHLTYGTHGLCDFSHPEDLTTYSWPLRNLTALQVLDAVWRGVE